MINKKPFGESGECVRKNKEYLDTNYYEELYRNPGQMKPFQQAGWTRMKGGQSAYKEMTLGALRGVSFSPNAKLLDVGCGIGEFLHTIYVWKEHGSTVSFSGIDATPTGIKRVVEEKVPIWAQTNKNTKKQNFKEGFVPDVLNQFQNDCFDYVVCNSVFQYIPPDVCEKTVLEMIRVSKNAVVVSDVHDKGLFEEVVMIHKKYSMKIDWGVKKKETFLERSWWNRFKKLGHEVKFHNVDKRIYQRAHYRYCVTINVKQ